MKPRLARLAAVPVLAAALFAGCVRDTPQPPAAVEVCHAEAPQIATAVLADYGVRMGRVAAPGRNRNPAQAADDWKLTTLESFQQAVDDGATGFAVGDLRGALWVEVPVKRP